MTFDLATLQSELIRDEGLKLKPYRDTVGKLTIGCGRNLDDVGISEIEARTLMANDIVSVSNGIENALPWVRTLSDARQRALINMGFQMGVHGLLEFRNMLGALERGEFENASAQALDSDWGRAYPNRAHRIATMIREG